jgi:phenylpyruvate tautomerase PptA (4-oxalocrotonate tautomerase family)
MPQIEIHLPKGAITAEAKTTLIEKATKLLLKMEGAPETPESLGITWCYVREYAPEDIAVGGKPLTYPVYRVVLTVPQGVTGFHGPAMKERREAMVRKTSELILAAEGAEPTHANLGRVWVQIIEVADGFWGGFGEIAELMDIATYMGAPIVRNPTERGKRSRAAFAELSGQPTVAV